MYSKIRNLNPCSKLGFRENIYSDHSINDDISSDEFLNLFQESRDKFPSYTNDEQKGPNINLKIQHKRYKSQEEKNFFFVKIKKKKKTELCKTYEVYHDCYYKDECCFAHGIEELRDNSNFSSYKTKICKNFQDNSVCFFGIRCAYKHIFK